MKAQLSKEEARAFSYRKAKESGVGNRAERRTRGRSAASTLAHGFEVNNHLPGLSSIGVLCLMDLAGIEEPSNEILVWSHYAASHKGVALGFRVRRSSHANLFGLADRVEYDVKPDIGLGDDEAYRKAILTKAPCWRYEREWRVVSSFRQSLPEIQESLDAGDFDLGGNMHHFRLNEPVANASAYFDSDDLAEIQFGARLTEDEKSRIVSIARACGLAPDFVNVKLHPTDFALVRETYR